MQPGFGLAAGANPGSGRVSALLAVQPALPRGQAWVAFAHQVIDSWAVGEMEDV
jgi:hypothetical protein